MHYTSYVATAGRHVTGASVFLYLCWIMTTKPFSKKVTFIILKFLVPLKLSVQEIMNHDRSSSARAFSLKNQINRSIGESLMKLT